MADSKKLSFSSTHHQFILITQGPICEIFTKKYWELGVHEKFFFFESPILIFFFDFLYLNYSQINGVAWMGLNFYDYHDFQKIRGALELWNTLHVFSIHFFQLIFFCKSSWKICWRSCTHGLTLVNVSEFLKDN